MKKENKIKEIYLSLFSEIQKNLTLSQFNDFEDKILEEAKNLGFDMDEFEMNGEFLEENGEISDSTILKSIYVNYMIDEPIIYHEWY